MECGHKRCKRAGRPTVEVANHRHRLLLCGGNARQRYRAAKQGNEAPTVHSILLQLRTARKSSTTRHGRGPMGAATEDTVSTAERACGNGSFRVEPLRSWA